jgi:hypothetical protein
MNADDGGIIRPATCPLELQLTVHPPDTPASDFHSHIHPVLITVHTQSPACQLLKASKAALAS